MWNRWKLVPIREIWRWTEKDKSLFMRRNDLKILNKPKKEEKRIHYIYEINNSPADDKTISPQLVFSCIPVN